MKRIYAIALILICTVSSIIFSPISALAGKGTTTSEPVLEDNNLNQTAWYFTDSNVICKDGSLVIPSGTSTASTKIIAKDVSVLDTAVEDMTAVNMEMSLTNLPKGQQFILAFGLSSIEANSKEKGNVEMVITNNGGLKFGIEAYTEAGMETILKPTSCGISMKQNFSVNAIITSESVLQVTVNGKKVCDKKLPVSGAGRFGLLQTGECGANISSLSYSCYYYETPENVNISEDFESGEFNVNTLYSRSKSNGLVPSAIKIDDYNGSKVLKFQNTGFAYVSTQYKYSNFELSFDMPYFLREVIYDEYGTMIGKPFFHIGISWGSEEYEPSEYTYSYDADMISLGSNQIKSELRNQWTASLEELNVTDINTNTGYSVKLRVIDGHMTLQVKGLTSAEYITVAETDYEIQRSGYIYIWSPGNANCAIDNLKITNLDKNPNLTEAEYKSSVITAEDYQLTEEDTAMVFRKDAIEENAFSGKIFLVSCGTGALILALLGVGISSLLKKKSKRKEE